MKQTGLALALVATLALGSCSGSSAGDPHAVKPKLLTATARVTLDVTAYQDSGVSGTCDEYGGYLGIAAGKPIQLQNVDRTVVATADLQSTKFVKLSGKCVWTAHFKNVPRSGVSYTAFLTRWRSNEVKVADLATSVMDIDPDA